MRKIFIWMVNFYQIIVSPLIHTLYGSNRVCRFTPTCSSYLKTAIRRYGIIRGLCLGFRRVIKCRPGTKGGFDPVK